MIRRLLIVLLAVLVAGPALAANPLQVSMVLRMGGKYMEPPDGVFSTVVAPIVFHIMVENVSRTSSQEAPVSNVFSFELVDAKGRHSLITRKAAESKRPVFVYLSPGASRQLEVVLHPNDWKNVPPVVEGEFQRLKIRAIYQTTGLKIFSKYYTLELGRDTE